jgi:uncharacterized membrane protein YgcG
MGEMLAAFGVIGIRAIADYVPAADFHSPGTENPNKGASPIALITATLATYFVLAFMATRGGWAARVAAAFGLLMIAALMINSENELVSVATWVENIGTNSANQAQPSVPAQPGTGGTGGTGTGGGKTGPPIVQNPGNPLS